MDRFSDKYLPEEVLSKVLYKPNDDVPYLGDRTETVSFRKNCYDKARVEFHGHMVRLGSSRLRTFALKGVKCVTCGIIGQFFVKERHRSANGGWEPYYHLNLYAIRSDGTEVLMTKDHIHPRSKKGRNHIDNYQPMCQDCNQRKGDSLP